MTSLIRFIRTVLGVIIVIGCLGLAVALLAPLAFQSRIAPTAPAPLPAPLRKVVTAALAFDPACTGAQILAPAASANAASLDAPGFSPFGVPEAGSATYIPLVSQEIGTRCAPESRAFAAALQTWQGAHHLPPNGQLDAATMSAMATGWLLRRPFVVAMKNGCPASPNEATLATAAPVESYGGKIILARPGALSAYRQMVAAARREIGVAPPIFEIASSYRGPAEEAARCADGSCGNPAKAHCSAHRTGLALDLYLGAPHGREAFSTAPQDRLYQSRTPAYRWLVKNAARFGFVPYPYEPWHWEWTGEPV